MLRHHSIDLGNVFILGHQNFEIIALEPVLAEASTLSSRLLMSCMSSTYCSDDARTEILKVLAWSFQCLCALQRISD